MSPHWRVGQYLDIFCIFCRISLALHEQGKCAVIPALHRRLSPGSGLLHHCMDIHLPSLSALAKCFTNSFSKVYDGRNQNLMIILRLLFLYLLGSSTKKKVSPLRINFLKRLKLFEVCTPTNPRAPRNFAIYLAGMAILVLSFSAHVFLLLHLKL